MDKFVLQNHVVKFFHGVIFHEKIDYFFESKVDDSLSFSDNRIGGGFFFITFDFSIGNGFPSGRVLELFD